MRRLKDEVISRVEPTGGVVIFGADFGRLTTTSELGCYDIGCLV